jgi:hypothetical protein
MSSADPSDPVPINRAIRELVSRWESEATSDGEIVAEQPNALIWEMSKGQLEKRFGSFRDAAVSLFRHAIVSQKVKVWVEDGPDWKRPTLHTIMRRLPPLSGLYVDRGELTQVFNRQWPNAFPDRTAHQNRQPMAPADHEVMEKAPRNRGRPKGLGYSLKDVPVYELILKAQRDSGDVESQHALVKRFAGEATGPSFETNVDRLRKGLPNWLDQNGVEWRRSKQDQIAP